MTFWEVLILLLVFMFIAIFLINLAMKRVQQTAAQVKADVEDFKLPKIKITDLFGYVGYQLFEMAKPGIKAKIGDWVKEKSSGIVVMDEGLDLLGEGVDPPGQA